MKCVYSDCPNQPTRHYLSYSAAGHKVLVSFCDYHGTQLLLDDDRGQSGKISEEEANLWDIHQS